MRKRNKKKDYRKSVRKEKSQKKRKFPKAMKSQVTEEKKE